MTKTYDPAAIAISAIENVSPIPVTRKTSGGCSRLETASPLMLMALFSDVNYATVLRLAIVFGISDAEDARAYVHARNTCAASNADFDAFVLEMEAVARASDGGRCAS